MLYYNHQEGKELNIMTVEYIGEYTADRIFVDADAYEEAMQALAESLASEEA